MNEQIDSNNERNVRFITQTISVNVGVVYSEKGGEAIFSTHDIKNESVNFHVFCSLL